jgi:hypothetical protein
MSRKSYQPSHLENKDSSEPLSCAFTRLYTPQNVMSFPTSAFYLTLRMKAGPTKYDSVVREVLQRIATCRFQSGSRAWPVGRIWDPFQDISGYSDAIKIPFGKYLSNRYDVMIQLVATHRLIFHPGPIS